MPCMRVGLCAIVDCHTECRKLPVRICCVFFCYWIWTKWEVLSSLTLLCVDIIWSRVLAQTSMHLVQSRRLYCVEWTQYSIRPKRSAVYSWCFPGPTRVVDANGTSIASAVFAGLTRWQTDWQTDRPRYSVGNNRRSALRRSQILLLSTATSIYWSSRLDRSDPLQESAAIFSCKIRRVAVYVETHFNIALKRAFSIGVLDRWNNCLLICWRTNCLVFAFDETYSATFLRLSDASVICRVT